MLSRFVSCSVSHMHSLAFQNSGEQSPAPSVASDSAEPQSKPQAAKGSGALTISEPGPAEFEKKLRNLNKKLRQIEVLKERLAAGETLEATQVLYLSSLSAPGSSEALFRSPRLTQNKNFGVRSKKWRRNCRQKKFQLQNIESPFAK